MRSIIICLSCKPPPLCMSMSLSLFPTYIRLVCFSEIFSNAKMFSLLVMLYFYQWPTEELKGRVASCGTSKGCADLGRGGGKREIVNCRPIKQCFCFCFAVMISY